MIWDRSPLYRRLYKEETIKNAWDSLKKREGSKGIDNITIGDFEKNFKHEKRVIAQKLKAKNYKFSNLKGVALDKKTGRTFKGSKKKRADLRGIKVSIIRDRVVQKAILITIYDRLDRRYRVAKVPSSYAYIKSEANAKKGAHAAVMKVHEHYRAGYRWCYKDDIVKFFDTVNREKLIRDYISPVLKDKDLVELIRKALATEVANLDQLENMGVSVNDVFPDLQEGIPQGSVLSPLFSNIYLKDFDSEFVTRAEYQLVRYADDFIIMCKSKEDAMAARNLAKAVIEGRLGLKLREIDEETLKSSDGKSIISLYKHVEFLGVEFDGRNHHPGSKAFKKLNTKLQEMPRQDKGFVQNLDYLQTVVDSWGSTYWFTSQDKAKYLALNSSLDQALSAVLKKYGLAFVDKGRSVNSLGIDSFEKAVAKHRARMLRKKDKK